MPFSCSPEIRQLREWKEYEQSENHATARGQLRIRVPVTDRTFTPKASGFVPCERMVWTGGFAPAFKGVRVFELRALNEGSTDFVMEERFSGLMLQLVKGSLPDFGPIFERYANDLKHEAERNA